MVWRPLANGPALRHQIFPANNVRGFGLLQRDREFQPLPGFVSLLPKRPQRLGGAARTIGATGEVHLVELSTQYEGLDNMVAFWNPAGKPAPMQPLRFGYTLYWTRETDMTLSTNRWFRRAMGLDPREQAQRQFVMDFDLPKFTEEDEPPKRRQLQRATARSRWRRCSATRRTRRGGCFLNMLPKPGQSRAGGLEMRAQKGERRRSERNLELPLESAMSATARTDEPGSWRAVRWRNGTGLTRRWRAIFTPCACATKCCWGSWSPWCWSGP